MRPTIFFGISATALSAALLFSAPLIAQEHRHERPPHRYKFIDIGTFGGPHSYGSVNGEGARLLNDEGVVVSYADTTTPDPNAPDPCVNPGNCLVVHAFRWRHGRLIDLGALGDENSSAAGSINDRGWSTGWAATGLVDRLFNFPEYHAVFWRGRRIFDLGTLPGGNTSLGISINNAGQVVGFSNNGVPDPFAMFPTETQVRTFLWEGGELEDIGTLGGPDATPGTGCDNQRPGVIVGTSYTSFTPNAGSGIPTQDPFLWDNGVMTDLGTLGGTFGVAQCTNSRHQVIGQSSLAETPIACTDGRLAGCHAFLWEDGQMRDLGTLGGPIPKPNGSMSQD